ncbi:MAG: hypothetical protein WAL14_09260 [Pseudolabrys sp.]
MPQKIERAVGERDGRPGSSPMPPKPAAAPLKLDKEPTGSIARLPKERIKGR